MRSDSAFPVLTFHQDRTIHEWFEPFFEKNPVLGGRWDSSGVTPLLSRCLILSGREILELVPAGRFLARI